MNLRDATILVVDDEPMLLAIFAKWLRHVGCGKVLVAADGAVALDLMKAESIDLLLTDVRMPVMDGIALVRSLAAMQRTLPSIVFVSGFGDVDHREMYSLGVEAFIAKPFDRTELLSVLDRAIAERSTLWQTEMAVAPRQSLLIRADRIAETASLRSIGLGRGGFSVCTVDPISPGKVNFRILLSDPDIEIDGQGYVRWCSRLDGKIGVELFYLNDQSRAVVIAAMSKASPRSFIPGL